MSGDSHTLAAGARRVASVPACGRTAAGRRPSLSQRPRPPPAHEPALQRSVAVSSFSGADEEGRRVTQRVGSGPGTVLAHTDEEAKAERRGGRPQIRALGGGTGPGSEPRLPARQLRLRGRSPSLPVHRPRPPASLLRVQCRGSGAVTRLCTRRLHPVPGRLLSPRRDPRARPHLSSPAPRRLATCDLRPASPIPHASRWWNHTTRGLWRPAYLFHVAWFRGSSALQPSQCSVTVHG